MRVKLFLNAVLCTMLAFTLGYGQRMQGPNAGPPNGRLLEQLNLSDTQKADFEKLNTEFAKQRVEQQAETKIAAIDLRALMTADSPDKEAIEKKINEISDLQAHNRILRVDHWFAVNKILNPDQQKIWKSMLRSRMRDRFASRTSWMHDRRTMRSGRMMRSGGMTKPPRQPMQQGNPGQ